MKMTIVTKRFGFNGCYLTVLFVSTMMVLQDAYAQESKSNSWSVEFKGIGIFSSPRVTDLNGDGVGDVIFGVGREEFKACDSAVIALNGINGEILWKVPSVDHIFNSAMFKDINGDHINDVFMAGRSAELMAINGKDGKVIWKFNKKQGGIKWYNFYNGQFIRDQDQDGVEDILISNGGNVLAAPFDKKNRYPGNLAVVSGKTGKLIARAQMPDGNEIYMSVVPLLTSEGKDYKVVFGTGGETLGGNLYVTTLSQIMQGDLTKSIQLDSSPSKGYIGPPIWVDITADGNPDIVTNAVEGKLIAFDGVTYKPIWTVKMAQTEAYSSVAPGYFVGSDTTPDFFVSYAVGQWPDLGWSRQFMINGATGTIAYVDSLGSYQTSTPVIIDLDGDGQDEAILNVNIQVYDAANIARFQNILTIINFKGDDVLQLSESYPGSNISSTPWIGDTDSDGLLDIIYCHGTDTGRTYSFTGIRVHRVATGMPIRTKIRWGAYMGNSYNGIFDSR